MVVDISGAKSRRKPLLENVGIGAIIERLGECRALNCDWELSSILTQTYAEEYCRDLCITVGSKLLLVDFKVPSRVERNYRHYDRVTFAIPDRLRYIYFDHNNNIRSNIMYLGLIHATIEEDFQSLCPGFYLYYAVPMTTIFADISKIVQSVPQGCKRIINRENIRVKTASIASPLRLFLRDGRLASHRALIPDCIRMSYAGMCTPNCAPVLLSCNLQWYCRNIERKCGTCLSCGGLCGVRVEIYRGVRPVKTIRALTLAELIWGLRCGTIGYTVKSRDEAKRLVNDISMLLYHDYSYYDPPEDRSKEYGKYYKGYGTHPLPTSLYLIIYTPGIGVFVIPLGRCIWEEELEG